MAAVSVAEAQEKLGELIDRVARGERVEILRDGEPVATLSAPVRPHDSGRKKEPIDFERLRILRNGMPPQSEDAGTFMRRMRDDERY
ncbi:type II toxin-antitoxin system Phd/YefM family antitoxin [Neorhizobium sp. NPDC001467]|uniref:type II toxin-antitoxin system Phd/YefM family antitoxin n=1 Tax=Neorhizobium sp. NPDC001467 TaxID=3390595 RepID=UPI003D047D8B